MINLLSKFSYYTLSGYLHDYKIDEENYIPGLTFNKISNIIEFDRRFRNVLMYAIECVEQTLKTRIAYNFAHEIGPIEYLNSESTIFKNEEVHRRFVKEFNKNRSKNKKLPFIRHHDRDYASQIPIWVGVQIFTMGNVLHFYKNLPTKNQKQIAREFNVGADHLISWIEYTTYARNLVAHHMRLYNFNMQKAPKKLGDDPSFDVTNKVVDVLLVLKHLFLDKEEWNNYVLLNIKSLLSEYSDSIELDEIGFPDDWYEKVLEV